MAKIQFIKNVGMNRANRAKLNLINQIIESYLERGFRLTLRQLYYQLVARDVIPNRDQEYAKISDLLIKGRMIGEVDWEAIVDRNRTPKLPYYSFDAMDAIKSAGEIYREDRQAGQKVYIELWVEKDALSEVLWYKSSYYHINLMVNRGYTSCTAVYESFNRFRNAIDGDPKNGIDPKKGYILYVGDHDPSGLDMVRDINDRLTEFGCEEVNVRHIALTNRQIQLYNPPPNPAKKVDPRYAWYKSKFGDTSWEVDTLTPEALHQTIDTHIKSLIDMPKFKAALEKEEIERKRLLTLPKMITDLRQFRDDMLNKQALINNLTRDLSGFELDELIALNRKIHDLSTNVPDLMNF